MKHIKPVFGLAISLSLALSACGPTPIIPIASENLQQAPGSVFVPPRIDFVLVEDDTGGISSALTQVNSQMSGLLSELSAQGWDYRFVTVPLTQDRAMSQIIASNFDSNWGASWVPPFPGADPIAFQVIPNLFRKISNYNQFIQPSQINYGLNGREPAFQNLRTALTARSQTADFLRDDAMLAVVLVSNGEDTSGINYCDRGDGIVVPCNDGSAASSYNTYLNAFRGLKNSAEKIKMYSVVSPITANSHTATTCLGGNAFQGNRYRAMAEDLGGKAYNLCSTPIASVFSDLKEVLKAERLEFRTRYLFLAQAPDLTTLKVTKYIGGNAANAVDVPQSATNGWTYIGYQSNVASIDYPSFMNVGSGYTIELHGTARLNGDDTAKIYFKQEGAQNGS